MPTVAHVAPPFVSLPPPGYGGIERIICELQAEQCRRGRWEPIVIAPRDSQLPGVFGTIHSLSTQRLPPRHSQIYDQLAEHYALSVSLAAGATVVHLHGTWGLDTAHRYHVPVMLSVYTDTSDSDVQRQLERRAQNVFLVANSDSTRRKAPGLGWLATIHEGVATSAYPWSARSDDYLVFVGVLAEHKGCDTAIQVALATGRRLLIIGRVALDDGSPEYGARQERYYRERIAPYVDGRQIVLLGELGDDRLAYVARAAALLAPMRWEEPFGRALVEALACGTPVIAFNRGAASEIVEHGVSGFVGASADEMVAAVQRIGDLDRKACRRRAVTCFDVARVAAEYERQYDLVARAR